MTDPIRVMIVDDSAFMRYTINRHLEADPDITVVGSAENGLSALAKIPSLKPDVITLDVEMPKLDGLATLERIMREFPTPVVMLSSLTATGARTTVKALMRGAVDFVQKPSGSAETRAVMTVLVEKIKSAAQVHTAKVQPTMSPDEPLASHHMGLRPFLPGDPLVVIGASTGGPKALQKVLAHLPADLSAAVVIVQHMPAGFTKSLAQRLNELSSLTVQEAVDGDRLAKGLVLLAPGDYHMEIVGAKRIRLNQAPRRNHVRPSVDITMESAANQCGSSVLGVILTGMGSDGTAGAQQIKAQGGHIIAEDEITSVVYGMPRSVIEAGWADKVVLLPDVAQTIVGMVMHERA